MHTIKNNLLFFLLCVFPLFSCSGNIDYNDPENVPEGVLRIFADKTTIKADGQQEITFTVKYGSRDVSTDKSMNLIYYVAGKETSVKPGVNMFSTTAPAEYTFKARYYSGGAVYTDNEVVIKAVAAGQSVGQKDYYQRLWGMQFTAVSCTYCPRLSASLKTVMQEEPGRIVLTAFHVRFNEDVMADPMRLDVNEEFRNVVKDGEGLPLFAFNMYKSQEGIVDEIDKIRQQKTAMLTSFPATCGVAVSADYDAERKQVTVTGKVTSNVSEAFRYHMFLVEDAVEYQQVGAEEGYVHDNVVRHVAASNKWGDNLNAGLPLEVGVEASVTRTISVDSAWNPENMRAVFVAMSQEGDAYLCNNVAECAFGASCDYICD